MSRVRNPGSRWLIGNERYPAALLMAILHKYREQPGWFRGARVRR